MVNFRYYFLVFLSMTISGCLDNAECTILAVFTLLLYVAILVKVSKFQLFMFFVYTFSFQYCIIRVGYRWCRNRKCIEQSPSFANCKSWYRFCRQMYGIAYRFVKPKKFCTFAVYFGIAKICSDKTFSDN